MIMVIFNSYVSLPEGMHIYSQVFEHEALKKNEALIPLELWEWDHTIQDWMKIPLGN